MNVKEVRKIIKDNNLRVVVKARTNGYVSATSFDVDDLNTLDELLNGYGYTILNKSVVPTFWVNKFALTKEDWILRYASRKVGA